MPFAIELYFDAVSEAKIRTLWNALVACGVRPERHNASRPHLSLAVCDELHSGEAVALVEELALAKQRFSLVFPALGIFPGARSVLFLAPRVTPELIDIQREFIGRFQKVSQSIWKHYLADYWNPHCTLASRIPRGRLSTALAECHAVELPMECTIEEVGIAALRPVKQQFVVPLRSDGYVSRESQGAGES